MRGDLQVDKGNGVGWGLVRKDQDPMLDSSGPGGAFLVANSKNSEMRNSDAHGKVLLNNSVI
jgi:hypothetical protein